MTDKQLKKLNRAELLELLLEQSKEIDRLQSELEETRDALAERNLKIEQCGSLADAAAELNSLFRTAQKTADMYLLNVQRMCAEKAEAAGKTKQWEKALRNMEGAPEDPEAPAEKAAKSEAPAENIEKDKLPQEETLNKEETLKIEETTKAEAAEEHLDKE